MANLLLFQIHLTATFLNKKTLEGKKLDLPKNCRNGHVKGEKRFFGLFAQRGTERPRLTKTF